MRAEANRLMATGYLCHISRREVFDDCEVFCSRDVVLPFVPFKGLIVTLYDEDGDDVSVWVESVEWDTYYEQFDLTTESVRCDGCKFSDTDGCQPGFTVDYIKQGHSEWAQKKYGTGPNGAIQADPPY